MLGRTQILNMFKETGALLKGHFILSSGLHSSQYLQCALVLQYPEYARLLGETLANKFTSDRIDTVISPALGGLIIGYEVARALKIRFIFTERKDSGHRLRRGFRIEPGERVLVIEDVVTTGRSSHQVACLVRGNQAEVVAFGAIADRSDGNLEIDGRFEALLKLNIPTFPPEQCPLCEENIPLVKPGSSGKN